MRNFEYVPKSEWRPVRENIENLIHLVQKEVRKHFRSHTNSSAAHPER